MVRLQVSWLAWAGLPGALLAQVLHAPALVRFVLAALALLPAARLLGDATDALASQLGPAAAGLLNATCGNAAELIIAILALRKGYVDVVQASLTGSIIGNLLLVLGLAFLVGGTRYKLQKFSARSAETQLASMALAVFALLLPAVFFHLVGAAGGQLPVLHLSVVVSLVLLAVYAASLVFSLRTHRQLLGQHGGEAGARWSKGQATVRLFLATGATFVASEVLVGSVEEVGHALGLGPVFLGVAILAVLGNAAEHGAAVVLAWRNQMDASITICFASSQQVALFVTPLLVLLSFPLGYPMSLAFSAVEVVAVGAAVVMAGVVSLNGESHWLEGVQLLALYLLIAAFLAFLPAAKALAPL